MGMFDDTWNDVGEITAFGLGTVGQKNIDIFRKYHNVSRIIDNHKQFGEWNGIEVMTLDDYLPKRRNDKIVVFATRNAYAQIRSQLEACGLHEYKDYCRFNEFVTEWYWEKRKQNCLREVHMSINTNCTFRCKNCNMFMPYYKNVYTYTLADVKPDLDAFFERIDFTYIFSLLGGEPLLNREIGDIISYINDNYRDKVGRIEIITNGSLVPNEDVLAVMKRCGVLARISDYTSQIPYRDKLQKLTAVLDSCQITYVVENSLSWLDFVFPKEKNEYEGDVRKHMMTCRPEFHGINDGRFYFCHVVWSAEKAGLTKNDEHDSIKLSDIDKTSATECRKIVEHAKGNIGRDCYNGGYISLCRYCMGCGNDNSLSIPVGEQMQ